MGKIIKYLGFSLFPLFALALGTELFARLCTPQHLSNKFFHQAEKGVIEVQLPHTIEPQRLRHPKPPGTFRIFFLGGSSTYGYPFAPVSSFPQRLEKMLISQAPHSKIEVINLGVNAFSSDEVLLVLRQAVHFQPDLIVAYMGHNELVRLSRFNQVAHPWIYRIGFFLREHSRAFAALIYLQQAVYIRERFEKYEEEVGEREDVVRFPEELRSQAAGSFERNLVEIIRTCRRHQTRLVMITVISNDAEFFPMKSTFGRLREKSEQEKYRLDLTAAQALAEEGQAEKAIAVLDGLVARDPFYARAYFLRGRAYLWEERRESARKDFVQARDLDDKPKRAPTFINLEIREICRREQVPLFDLESRLQDRFPDHFFGFDVFYDCLHPNLEGQQMIAETLLAYLFENQLLPRDWPGPKPLPTFEEINSALNISDEFRITRALHQAFHLGFSFEAPRLYLEYASTLLEQVQALYPQDSLATISRGALRLRLGDPEGGRALWEPLLRKDETKFFVLLENYFYPLIPVLDNLILFDPAWNHNLLFLSRRQRLLENQPSLQRMDSIEIPESLDYLGRFRYALEWNRESGQLLEVSRQLSQVLEKRKVKLEAMRKSDPPLILREFRPLNCAVGSRIDTLRTLNPDAQLIFSNLALDPLLVNALEIELEYLPAQKAPASSFKAELYWATQSEPQFSEHNKWIFQFKANQLHHRFRIPVANRWRWISGDIITRLRLDPTDQPGVEFKFSGITIFPLVP